MTEPAMPVGPGARLLSISDAATGFSGAIAIHSTALRPAAGGCRLWKYEGEADLREDALRLARGMSYKNALAGLPFGGGKAVLQLPSAPFDREALFRFFGDAVEAAQGAYVTAEDVGTTTEDMKVVRQRTPYVAGLDAEPGRAGGNPSPWTALGVFEAMEVAARRTFGSDLRGLTVAVQGVGSVGGRLCSLLVGAGAKVIITDVEGGRAARLAEWLGATAVSPEEIYGVNAQIFAPCALGGILNPRTISQLKARLVCGGANNQLSSEQDGMSLLEHGIVYAPDYVVNAGGIINVSAEYLGETSKQVTERIQGIGSRLVAIFDRADQRGVPPNIIADQMAEKLISQAPNTISGLN